MDPSTLMMVVQGIGAIGSMIGGIGQANRQGQAYDDAAQANILEKRRALEVDKKETDRLLAKNQARTEAGGIVSGSGSPLEFELENAFTAGMNRAWKGWEYDWRTKQLKSQAGYARGQIPGMLFGGLTNLASIGGKWYTASKTPTSNPFAGQKADVSWSGYS